MYFGKMYYARKKDAEKSAEASFSSEISLDKQIYRDHTPLPDNYYNTPDMDYSVQGESKSLEPFKKVIVIKEPLEILIAGNDCNGSVTLGWTAPMLNYTGTEEIHVGQEVRNGQGKDTTIHEKLHWSVPGEEPVRQEVRNLNGGKLQGPAEFYSGMR